MPLKRINLHNHTIFSDGKNTPKELIKKAIESKLEVVAITDHIEYFLGFCKFKSDMKEYFEKMKGMKKMYSNKIKILCGFEIDLGICEEEDIPFEFLKEIDIVLFERVNNFEDLYKLIEIKKRLPIKVGLAHPSFEGFKNFNRLIDVLEKNRIFVELNTSCYKHYSPQDRPGLRAYPLLFETQEDFFRLLKSRNVEISISNDVHKKEDNINDIDKAYLFLKRLDLEKNFINI